MADVLTELSQLIAGGLPVPEDTARSLWRPCSATATTNDSLARHLSATLYRLSLMSHSLVYPSR